MVIAGCMLVGIGLGLLFDQAGAGTMIGLGVGLVLDAVLRQRRASGGS